MKKVAIILILCSLRAIFPNLSAQNNFSKDCSKAFQKANADLLCNYFDTSNDVEIGLVLPKNTGKYSGYLACEQLKRFFQTYSIQSFQILHEGRVNGSAFFVGKLVTKDTIYRVNILVREKEGAQWIKQLRIEK